MECNRDPPLKADDAQACSDVVAARAALRGQIETETIRFYALDVPDCARGARAIRNIVVQSEEVGLSFRRKDDLTLFHVVSPSGGRYGVSVLWQRSYRQEYLATDPCA